ncbi:TraV family lipoprotein [Burkholderia stagnalis]|uniref:TraV family lipoprotein n=1 Tax=Burkholderia stagnalis TaxID=1503054 RepID=UPI001629A528|nr:TraV family lipoprotein [Burkholderia stagnalis]
MNRPIRKAGTLAMPACVLLLLAGCSAAFNPIGSNTYDCNRKQDPSSIYCHSFRAVEASTNGRLPDSRFDTELKFSQYDKATDIAPPARTDVARPPLLTGSGEPIRLGSGGTASPGTPASDIGSPAELPVRAGPVIQRTWIKRFVDDNDMLTSNLTVFKEVIPSRWTGFDGGNPTGAARGTYPHLVADAAMPASGAAAATPNSPQPALSPSPNNDFIQPGAPLPGSENPAGISMPTSMPQ